MEREIVFQFREFKQYAHFLLENQGIQTELSERLIEQLRNSHLPTIQFLFRLPSPQALSIIQSTIQTFLKQSLDDNVLDHAVSKINGWGDRSFSSNLKEEKYDLLRMYGILKQLLISFLNKFTQDLFAFGAIVKELEDFQILLEEYVFDAEPFNEEQGAVGTHEGKKEEQSLGEAERKVHNLQRINNELGNFVYMVSHDLRTPVSNLEGLLELLRKMFLRKADKEEVQTLEMTELAVGRLKTILNDILEVAKVQKEENEVSLEAREVEFKKLIQDVKDDIHSLIVENHALIVEELNVKEIVYPKANLRSIIYNLLSNAVKYGASDRPLLIEVKTYLQDGYIVLSVKDNGMGMSFDQLKNLFSMFNRMHQYIEGIGIGLYAIKRMVEGSGGKIDIKSKEGEGSEFLVYLPNDQKSI